MGQLAKSKKLNVEATKDAQTPPEETAGEDPALIQADLDIKQTEKMGKEADIRRQEEKHAQGMAHADEAHTVKVATDTTKAAQELAIKGKQAEHDLAMKEKMTKAGAEAKIIAAKKKPAPAKPAKPAKKGGVS
jgi:hypothetical protein